MSKDDTKKGSGLIGLVIFVLAALVAPIAFKCFYPIIQKHFPDIEYWKTFLPSGYLSYCGGILSASIAASIASKQLRKNIDAYAESRERDEKKLELQQKEFKRQQEKLAEDYEKELEQRRDHYRPFFVQDAVTHNVKLIMKEPGLCIMNVQVFINSNNTLKNSHKYSYLEHNNDIDLEGHINNYFITAQTMLGERIIFGSILGGKSVYKALIQGQSPHTPQTFNPKSFDVEKMNEVWRDFNCLNLDTISSSDKSNKNIIDWHFMHMSQPIRNYMSHSLDERILNLLSRGDNIKNLLDYTALVLVDCSSEERREFGAEVLKVIIEILFREDDNIFVVPSKLSWGYIEGKSFAAHIDNKTYTASLRQENRRQPVISIVRQCIGEDFQNDSDEVIDLKARILHSILEYSDVNKDYMNEFIFPYYQEKIVNAINQVY